MRRYRCVWWITAYGATMETEEIQNDGDDFKILKGKKGNSKECEKHQNKIIFSLPSELSTVLLPNIHKANWWHPPGKIECEGEKHNCS